MISYEDWELLMKVHKVIESINNHTQFFMAERYIDLALKNIYKEKSLNYELTKKMIDEQIIKKKKEFGVIPVN